MLFIFVHILKTLCIYHTIIKNVHTFYLTKKIIIKIFTRFGTLKFHECSFLDMFNNTKTSVLRKEEQGYTNTNGNGLTEDLATNAFLNEHTRAPHPNDTT